MAYKNLKISIFTVGGLFLASVFLLINNVNSYSGAAHPDLTREIITFYELSTGKKLTDEQKRWVIQGSRDEDFAPRWINHFYDPIFERGLSATASGLGYAGYSAKNWAQYSSYQTITPSNIGNLWSGNGPVISGSWWGDFSYEAAIKDYSKDKEKEAYLALGHVLHLIEDITVPEHTRNDPHPGEPHPSYYENWTKENSSGLTQDLGKRIFNQNYKLVIYSDLESYFNNLAIYTNTHFFSPRTIKSDIYQKPKIIYEDGTFAYGKDENSEFFDLAIVTTDKSLVKTYTLNSSQILQEYWLRLSRQAIINGAGVIGLFLNQAEAAKQVELAKQKVDAQQTTQKSSLISQIYNFFTSPDAPANEPALTITSEPRRDVGAQPAKPSPKIVKQETATKPLPVKKPVTPAPTQPKQAPNVASPNPAPASTPTLTQTPAPASTPAPAPAPQTSAPVVYSGGGGGSVSSSNSSQNQTESLNVQTFNVSDLVINEIMYDLEGNDGIDSDSHAHEWIELYNNSSHEIDITGWKFDDGATSLHGLNGPPTNGSQGSMIIPVSGYAVLSGSAATFLADHSGFSGTVIDTVMSLKNSTSTIKIAAPAGTIIDEVTYYSSWGANGNGKTLERKSAGGGSNDSANWGFSSVNGGTPGAVNNWFIAIDLEIATSTPTMGLGTDVSATTTIAVNTTWILAGSPYRLFFDSPWRHPTVAAGAVLTILPGVKIIPQSGNYTAMEIFGTLNAVATSGAPIIFTSTADADGLASTTPQKGEWLNIAFSQGAQANLDYVEFRYGGQGITLPLHEMVNIVGATVNIKNSKFENSQSTALHLMDSLGVVENSIFSNNDCGISIDSVNGVANVAYGGCYGIHTTGQVLSAAPQIINNQFMRNRFIGVEVRSGTAPTISGNIFTDNGYPVKIESSYPAITNSQLTNSTTSPDILKGIAISGYTHFSHDFTLKNNPQLPYILETNGPANSPYVDAGATLTLEPGAIFKIGHTFTALNVNGSLVASTTPDNPIVFTSLKDDSRGGDTNGDGSVTSPQNSDWANIKFFTGSIGTFVNTVFSYGGSGYIAPTPLPPILLANFSSTALSWSNSEAVSGVWTADKNGSFEKIVFHNFSMSNPNSLASLVGIKRESDNSFIASTTTSSLKDIVTIADISVSLSGNFTSGEGYYATLKVIPPSGTTTVSAFDLFGVGKDANQKAAVAFYESAIQPYSNPAISIDSGATVVVK